MCFRGGQDSPTLVMDIWMLKRRVGCGVDKGGMRKRGKEKVDSQELGVHLMQNMCVQRDPHIHMSIIIIITEFCSV